MSESRRTFWCLYREPYQSKPLTAYFRGEGFRAPRRDEALTKTLMVYLTKEAAEEMARLLLPMRSLSGPALVAKRSYLLKRIRSDVAS
jgi:hypothetical protein